MHQKLDEESREMCMTGLDDVREEQNNGEVFLDFLFRIIRLGIMQESLQTLLRTIQSIDDVEGFRESNDEFVRHI